MLFLGFILTGFLAGMGSGLFGIGGGIVMVPVLMWFFGFSQLYANALSLMAMLLPVGLLAVSQYFKQDIAGFRDFKFSLLLSLGLVMGGYVGAKLALQIHPAYLKKGFSLVLIFAAVRLWLSAH